ncbi:MAG: RNA methyltransferase [Candidatus Helarchaeota archaeon]|nr:RNA methyltransferase [Candidatus Helarchaeota archaeon]
MQKKFNLLISCPRFHERDAIAEAWYLFSNIGEEDIRGELSSFPGLITAKCSQDPIQCIRDLRVLIEEDPSYLRFVLKIIPIEVVTETNFDEISKIIDEFGKRISENESFRITLKGRQSPFDSQELIIKLAEKVDRKVNLNEPDKTLMIQILGDITGISLLSPGDILSKAEFPY